MTTEGRLEAVVLAAGAGVRFGGAKLTATWREGPLIYGALGAAFAAPARSVSVIMGADPAVGRAAEAFAVARGEGDRLRLLHAAHHAEGMGASLSAAVRSLSADTDGVFVFLGDMPRVPAAILPRLAQALAAGGTAAAPVFESRRGHPVLFGRALFDDLATLGGDEGARALLSRIGDGLTLVETGDPGVLFDVDVRDQT